MPKSALLENIFPKLANTSYDITSPQDDNYNCIAWAANDNSNAWWPDPFNQYYWPEKIPREQSLQAFIDAYQTLGYSVCNNGDVEQGFEKIALYENLSGPSHAARQFLDGTWTSKLGDYEDINHVIDALEGVEYGQIVRFLKRHINK